MCLGLNTGLRLRTGQATAEVLCILSKYIEQNAIVYFIILKRASCGRNRSYE